MRKLLFTALGAVLMGSVLVATPAHADARNGVCEDGEVCLYFNSDTQGSLVDFAGSVKNYGTGADCVKFVGPGNGRGQCVKNNAASVWNRKSVPVTIFFNSDWSGPIDSFVGGRRANLSATLKNENASHVVGEVGNDNLAFGLYQTGGGGISTYFDGYQNTPGRHEGIDISRGAGVNVFSLTAGTVINKDEGGGGLSTISIFNAELNVSIIYLHTNPLPGLSVGEHVERGQRIATEAARGASSPHTHVEMRPGRHELASVSVGDPTLDNPIPTQFWMNRGYNICCQ